MIAKRVDSFIADPKKALFKLSYPIIIAMLVQTLYNIVDTAFVGRLGADSIAALTFSFPLFFILMAVSQGISMGMSSRVSRMLGARRKTEAENTAVHGIILAVVTGIVVMAVGLPLLKPLFGIFGADETVLPLAVSYMSTILYGTVVMFAAYSIIQLFSAQGDTKVPMIVQIIALIANIILDPIFIYYFGMGVRGAALASVTAFSLGLLFSIYFLKKRSHLRVSLNEFKFSWETLKDILVVGIPGSATMFLMSIYVMFINKFMAHFSTEHVAAFGISTRLENLAVMPVIAMTIATMTLVGMFYGAKRYDLVKFISWYSIRISLVFTSVVGVIMFLFPEFFLNIFTNEAGLIDLAIGYVRINVFTFPLMVTGMMTARIMQAMGRGLPGFVISIIRIAILSVPLAYVFVYVLGYGYLSIPVAMVLGGFISSVIAFVWLFITLKNLNDKYYKSVSNTD